MKQKRVESSFRDPSGFLFFQEGELYRQINKRYREDFELLKSSGLLDELWEKGLLIRHEEKNAPSPEPENCYKIIKPRFLPFITYPYEWCFSELKDAALLTLKIEKIAMRHGMSLKDASAYNIQFLNGRPVLIDTLSFEKLDVHKPWVAYRQFCQHFFAPLALASFVDIRLNNLLRDFVDGIPLDLAGKLLPLKTRFNFSILTHIHLHGLSQAYFSDKKMKPKMKTNKFSQIALMENLEKSVRKLDYKKKKTEWGSYYNETNYNEESFKYKEEIIKKYLDEIKPKSLWDLGGNTGHFTRLASDRGVSAVSFDIDYLSVEKNYLRVKKYKEKNILPLYLDLTNPSPSLGWAHQERDSLEKRGPVDMVMALALIHHLAISNNLPFKSIAEYFSALGEFLIIEFVPKSDSNVRRLLRTRADIFPGYDEENFEKDFSEFYAILTKTPVKDSARIMYLMRRKNV